MVQHPLHGFRKAWIIRDNQAGTVIVDTGARDPVLFTQPGQSGFRQERAVTQFVDMQTDWSRDRMAESNTKSR